MCFCNKLLNLNSIKVQYKMVILPSYVFSWKITDLYHQLGVFFCSGMIHRPVLSGFTHKKLISENKHVY